MLLTITTTHRPAPDLGYLLEKHPGRCQSFELSFGKAHVFYPVVTEERCSAALLLDLDPIGLVRGRRGGEAPTLGAYVNDRPYVGSSFFSVAIAQVFGSALGGRSRERSELAKSAIPLEVSLSALRCRGGESLVQRLFAPLGYDVTTRALPLDPEFPEWGPGAHLALELRGQVRLCELLAHLYVLMPVLDNDKHYFVGDDEVDKLLAKGASWLPAHPERELIVSRFLKYRRSLARDALERLAADDEVDPDANEEAKQREEAAVEERVRLSEQRLGAVIGALKAANAKSVIDLGCGEGHLLRALMQDKDFTRIVGMDVSPHVLERARERLRLDEVPERQQGRISLVQGSLVYRDERLAGFDAACLVEVIEHLDLERVPVLERVLFEHAKPRTVVVTTPNVEYNVRFEGLPAGSFRHRDHRFEWSREQFQAWANRVAEEHGYAVRFVPVGPEGQGVGAPTQMGVFSQ